MVTQKNNFHEFETYNIFLWIFKAYVAIYLVTNTFNITMAVFDVGQHVVNNAADYKSAKSTVLSCGVFSIWVFGNFAPIFLNRESYMVMLTEGYGTEYAATLNTYMPMWIAPILLVACFVFGLVGGMIGKAICKKHFQRAGIA